MNGNHDRYRPRRGEGSPAGRCGRCGWSVVADSHPAVVEAYQNHLREHHPDAWLRG